MTREHAQLMARVGTAIYSEFDLPQTDRDAVYNEVEALITEVERLRAERHIDNEQLARAWDESRDMERAAVVAWLRGLAADATSRVFVPLSRAKAYLAAADAIERGLHRREEKP